MFLVLELHPDIVRLDLADVADLQPSVVQRRIHRFHEIAKDRKCDRQPDEKPDRMGEVHEERATLDVLLQFRERNEHLARSDMKIVLQVGDLDFVGTEVFVALERRQGRDLGRGVSQLHGVVRDGLDKRHRYLPLTAAVHGHDDVADLARERIDNDFRDFADFPVCAADL
jgi:hypothetical protein